MNDVCEIEDKIKALGFGLNQYRPMLCNQIWTALDSPLNGEKKC